MEMTGSLKEAMHSLNVNHSHDVAIAQTIEDGLEEQMYLFADRLEIGCSLACITGDSNRPYNSERSNMERLCNWDNQKG